MRTWWYIIAPTTSIEYTDPLTLNNICSKKLPDLSGKNHIKLDQLLYLFDINDFCPNKDEYMEINKLIVNRCGLSGNSGDDYIQSYIRWSKDDKVNLACTRSDDSGKYCLESIKNAETNSLIGQPVKFDNCVSKFVSSDVKDFPFFYLLQIKKPENLKRKLKENNVTK